MILFMKS